MVTATKGSTVKVQYEGRFNDGTVFDSSASHGAPLEFEVGAQQVIPGFEHAVMGMKSGEKKEIVISPAEGYGEYNSNLIKKVPRNQLPPDQVPKSGMVLMVKLPDGTQLPAKITSVTEENISIDLNHPLAGKTLHFTITVVAVA